MRWGTKRVPALGLVVVAFLLALSLPAVAAGRTISITKYDENFRGQQGVTFELYQDNPPVGGTRGAEDTLVQSAVTDAAGAATFTNVPTGDYWIHEVTPAGYVDNPDQSVKVKRRGALSFVFSNTPQPSNSRVNDPTGDASYDDGTHIADFGPAVAATPGGGETLVAWNDTTGIYTPGGVSLTNTALSLDGGATWEQLGKVPTGSSSSYNLGEPNVLYDPTRGRWVIASNAVTATVSGIVWPINVNTSSDGPSGFWNPPVNATPNVVPGSGDIAHGASLAFDPTSANLYLGFVLSHSGSGTSEAMFTRSLDGGSTFVSPFTLFGPDHVDFVDLAVGPNGNLHSVAASLDGPFYDILYARSTDGGVTWSSPSTIVQDLPRSGVAGACTGSDQRGIFGRVFAADAPTIAASPFHKKRLFVSAPSLGAGGDESDVHLFMSSDAGTTWSELQGPPAGSGASQFYPRTEVTPDGRVAVAYYQGSDPTEIAPRVGLYSAFSGSLLNDYPLSPSFSLWETDPSYDTDIVNCHGMDRFLFAYVGSGLFVAWTDGRDPGPAGNGGIDPNIYFAHTEGPAIPTDLSAVATLTARKIKVSGSVTPTPLAGARVVVTLFEKGPDGFEKIGRHRPATEKAGAWDTSFRRPDGGRCRLEVEFRGSEGREPSVPGAASFAC